jgi:hypothetical protein
MRTDTQRKDYRKTQGEDGHLSAKDGGLRPHQPCHCLDLGLLAFIIHYVKINFYCLSQPACGNV